MQVTKKSIAKLYIEIITVKLFINKSLIADYLGTGRLIRGLFCFGSVTNRVFAMVITGALSLISIIIQRLM
jgi:hypothetical protein